VPSGLIVEPGAYPSRSGHHTLDVHVDANRIVRYSVRNKSGTLFADDLGSDAMRWCLFWDVDERLWAYSSDIGFFVWTNEGRGFERHSALDVKYRPLMPKEVHDYIPALIHSLPSPTAPATLPSGSIGVIKNFN
jgi:hypothetical protein